MHVHVYKYNISKRIIVKDQNFINMNKTSNLSATKYIIAILLTKSQYNNSVLQFNVEITINHDVTRVVTNL